MSKASHIYRRGNVLYFRISVPERFRDILCVSEFTQSLRTQNRKDAIPAAYKLAGEAKILFNHIDSLMSGKKPSAQEVKRIVDSLFADKDKLAGESTEQFVAKMRMGAAKPKKGRSKLDLITIIDLNGSQVSIDYNGDIAKEMEACRIYQEMQGSASTQPRQTFRSKTQRKVPLLSVVHKSLIDNLDSSTPAANKKTKAAKWWDMFIELTGDKSIEELEQIDIDHYLEAASFLPSNDTSPVYKGLTFKEKIKLCKKSKAETISKKAFVNGYKSPIKKFIEHGYKEFRVDGFKKLSVDSTNKYEGNQEPGKNEQRPLTIDEVGKLVNNEVMQGYVDNPKEVHKYWLVMMGLFSGARLNEICQLHPVRDIRQDKSSAVWFFEVTEDDDDKEGVKEGEVNQLAKSEAAKREVPIHQKLIDLGFIDYVLKRREEGAATIFPFVPRKVGDMMRAGSNAGVFMTTYLKKLAFMIRRLTIKFPACTV